MATAASCSAAIHTALAWLLWLPHSGAPRLLANECAGQGLGGKQGGEGGQETAPVLFAFHSRGESALWVDPCSLNWRQWVLNSRFGEQAQTGKRNLTKIGTAAGHDGTCRPSFQMVARPHSSSASSINCCTPCNCSSFLVTCWPHADSPNSTVAPDAGDKASNGDSAGVNTAH